MKVRFPLACSLALSFALCPAASAPVGGQSVGRNRSARATQPAPLARIVWLEPEGDKPERRDDLPVFRPIAATDPRLRDYERWADTEAGRLARRLVYRTTLRFGADQGFQEPVLAIVVRKGGNNAEYGLSIKGPRGIEAHPKLPYVILDPSPSFLGDTVLHETGHVLHRLAIGGRRSASRWSAFPHTTFATTDPLTAVAEGYAIHFETLWGHFGADPGKQAYYRRLAPSFAVEAARKSHYFAQVDDLLTFAQVWSRYQAVRDGMPAFEGHEYPGAYPRTQMDPARDCARLKPANAMIASEGVVASVFFWIAASIAGERGAMPASGLDQPGIVDAEMDVLEAFAVAAPQEPQDFRPDVLDIVAAMKRRDPHLGDIAITRLVDITHGVTARPSVRDAWRTLYGAAITLDIETARNLVAQLNADRGEIVEKARQDATSLRAGVGPVVAVTVRDLAFQLKALNEHVPVEFDLNAMGDAEIALLKGLSGDALTRFERERERAPFASTSDFETRTGLSLQGLGLAEVKVDSR